VRQASGEWRWHNTTGNAVYDTSGKFVYFTAISRDITEHKKAEELLQTTEQNFRNSLDASPLGIRIIDSERRSLYVNQECLNIFGYKNIDEVGGYPLRDHYTPEEHAKFVSRQERRARAEIVPENMRVEIKRRDGAIRYLEVSDSEVVWDGKPRREIIYKDVTENELAKRALQESEEKYRLIVENSTDIIFTLESGRFIYLSPSIKNILGYKPEALIGVAFHSFVHPDDVHVIDEAELIHHRNDIQFPIHEEYRFRDASGLWRWLSSTGTLMRDRNEKSFNFVGVARDITQQKESEEEKRVLEEKAQVASRLAAIGEMAAGIAHEINNPLTSVIGFSQILLEKENVPEDIKSEIRIIADGSQRVASIVKRLLTFARQTKPDRTLANVNELIDNTLKLRDYVLKTSNIEVVTRFDPELPWSVIDPGQIQQVFLNLIVNAEQAMKKAQGKGTLAITTEKMGNRIHISFQDDGPGITREHLSHLFEPFFTTKEPGEGTGLGLSLSRSIVLEHGGSMWVQSESGHGAIFVVEIPIIASLPLDETKPLVSEVKRGANKKIKILVMDDESAIRELLEKLFKQMGNTIDSFSDAKSAIEQLDAGTIYDVILLDIRMPGMSGEEFYTRIVKINPALKGKIIIITGDVMGPDIKDFLKKNDLPYMAKPFDIKSLKEKIDTVTGLNH
jgi:PAS domain S-box-containing protein